MICHLKAEVMTYRYIVCLLVFSISNSLVSSVFSAEARIAVASNFRETALSISELLEEGSNHQFRVIAGSTGKLASQIINGAPFDVLMAADPQRPALLVDKGLASRDSIRPYARGRLGLWWPNGPRGPYLSALGALDPRQVCIANPAFSPYGQATEHVAYSAGLSHEWIGKTMRVDNINLVTAMVSKGYAEAGFVALSTIRSAARLGHLSIDEDDIFWMEGYPPILQTMILLRNGSRNPAAKYWTDQMHSSAVEQIILRDGYTIPDGRETR